MMFSASCFYFVTSTQGVEFSNIALLLRNLAKVEDIDINMIGKFQQDPAETVIILLVFHIFKMNVHLELVSGS